MGHSEQARPSKEESGHSSTASSNSSMCINRSNFGTGCYVRLNSSNKFGSCYGKYGGLRTLTVHHTCMYSLVIKLAVVFLIALEAGNVQGLHQDTKTMNNLGGMSRKNDITHFTLYQHQQNPTHYDKQRQALHISTELNRNSQKAINRKQSTEMGSEEKNSGDILEHNSECIITVINETTTITSDNCGLSHSTRLHEHALDQALNHIDKQNTSVHLRLLSDHLTLHDIHTLENRTGIHVSGNHTRIQCNSTQESGLSFRNCINITLENITLSECGANHKSTSMNFINKSIKINSSSAIYLSHCLDITFYNVTVNSSDGAGLTMVNCGGTVNIIGSNFTNNSIKTNVSVPGGGGITIELCKECILSEYQTNTVKHYSNTRYNIQNCQFINNNASSGKFLITHITSNHKNYFTYGLGGGLSVNLGHNANGNVFNVSNSYFKANKAQRGGGFFIGYRTGSNGNNVTVCNCTFLSNTCDQAELPPGGNYSSGGGMGVIFYTNINSSNLLITDSNFTKNIAYFGGGLSMGSGTTYTYDEGPNLGSSFTIQWSVFDRNNARIGAALDLYYRVSVEQQTNHGSSVLANISDSTFTKNGGIYRYSTINATGRTFATIYIVYIPVFFYGNITIFNNTASGFGVEEATVQFKENAFVNLIKNEAKIGGGMALIGRATVVLHENTTVEFHLNQATERGGAIFSSQSQERYTAYDYTCFIQYQNHNITQDSISLKPSEWKARLIFSRNQANSSSYTRNEIYASSVLPCVWPSSPTSNLASDISDTFCGWNSSWLFRDISNDTNCTDLITTAPSQFRKATYSVQVTPGNVTQIPNFAVCDDLGHDVSSSALYTVSKITLLPSKQCVRKRTQCNQSDSGLGISVSNDGILLTRQENITKDIKKLTVFLQTADRKSITTEIVITILECPPGYKLHEHKRSKCICSKKHSFKGLLACNESFFTSKIFAGYCMTYSYIAILGQPKKKHFVIARCPYVVGAVPSLYIQLPPYSPMVEDLFCKRLKRTGKLCGECQPGYGLDIYSTNFQCIVCEDTRINWIKAIAASTVPTTLLFILCTVFHISITSAPTNGYIFFSHMITMRLDVLTVKYAWVHFQDKHSLTRLLHVPYQLWTFDFPQIILPQGVCLGKSFKVIDALALHYLSVLYPLLLVLTAIVLIELHAKNFKPLVWLWKPLCYLCVRFRHTWHIRTTVIDTFASFLLLSYSNLIGVSMSLLTPSNIMISDGTVVGRTLNYDTSVEFFKQAHLKFGVLAIIILCTFGAIPPILLILYPFKWFQYLINRCNLQHWHFLHIFVDAFQGSYKNGIKGYPERRYFAGVYFLFRIAINAIYLAVEDMITLHLTLTLTYVFFMLILMAQRPYKKNFYNILDGVFMSILVTTHAMTVYLFYHAQTSGELPENEWYFTYSIQHIPTLYMILLVTYLVSFRMRCVKRFCLNYFGRRSLFFKNEAFNDKNTPKSPLDNYDWPSSSSLVIPSPSSPHAETRHISDIPDRVENPHRYEPLFDSWQQDSHKGSLQDFSVSQTKRRTF